MKTNKKNKLMAFRWPTSIEIPWKQGCLFATQMSQTTGQPSYRLLPHIYNGFFNISYQQHINTTSFGFMYSTILQIFASSRHSSSQSSGHSSCNSVKGFCCKVGYCVKARCANCKATYLLGAGGETITAFTQGHSCFVLTFQKKRPKFSCLKIEPPVSQN